MENKSVSAIHRSLKWLWLIFLTSILPVSALYLSTPPAELSLVPIARIWLFLLGAGFFIFWIATQSLLSIHRFPLNSGQAARLWAGQVLQVAVVLLAGSSWLFVFYASFAANLTASIFVVLALTGWRFLGRSVHWFRVLVLLCFVFLCLLFLDMFIGPLVIGLSTLKPWQIAVDVAAMAVNAVNTALVLYHFPVFGRPARLGADYDRTWQRWAPPTLILLIISVVAAAVIANARGIH